MRFKLVISIVLVAILVLPILQAVPPWKRQPVETEKEIVVINNTASPEKGTDWEMISAFIAIAVAFAGVVGWILTRKRKSITSKYLREINQTFETNKRNLTECESKLLELKNKIEEDFSKGKLTEQSFDILDRRLDKYLGEVRKGIVHKIALSSEARKVIDKALADGKISDEEYKELSKLDLKELSKEAREKLFKLIRKWKEKRK